MYIHTYIHHTYTHNTPHPTHHTYTHHTVAYRPHHTLHTTHTQTHTHTHHNCACFYPQLCKNNKGPCSPLKIIHARTNTSEQISQYNLPPAHPFPPYLTTEWHKYQAVMVHVPCRVSLFKNLYTILSPHSEMQRKNLPLTHFIALKHQYNTNTLWRL